MFSYWSSVYLSGLAAEEVWCIALGWLAWGARVGCSACRPMRAEPVTSVPQRMVRIVREGNVLHVHAPRWSRDHIAPVPAAAARVIRLPRRGQR